MTKLAAAALAALPLVAFAQGATSTEEAARPAPAVATPPVREGLYVGLGVGYSRVYDSISEGGIVSRLRVGKTVSRRLMLGVEAGFSDWASDEQLTMLDAGATFFPAGKLFFLRGGFGYSGWKDLTSGAAAPTRRGANLLGGLGVQLGNPDGINFTLNLEGQLHVLPYGGVDSSKGDLQGKATWSALAAVEWH